ncbi:TRAP transporter small permease subunit [Flavimaricola marinus]|uniref:TRAP transporter small permease protein n=1 Tax=Flavimaricola marinus TaxID=1819565 RepID=A0A238LFG7_9RHOB|nr:TRAP transporter small permease [Flavimaricola marinus]SMY08154.1 Tripartite ATP-independent periplasmic transporters, DctQ component [Flavimaricola marinus]
MVAAILRPVLRAIDLVCVAGAVVAAIACAIMAVMLVTEVIATSFFGWSQPWAVEFSGYSLLAVFFAGSGWALRQGAHIRVTLVTQSLPPRGAWALDVLASFGALIVTCYASYALIRYALRSAELGSVSTYLSQTPLALPQGLLAASFVLLALALFARITRLLTGEDPELPVAGAIE